MILLIYRKEVNKVEDLRNLVIIIASIIASIKGTLDIIDWFKKDDDNDQK